MKQDETAHPVDRYVGIKIREARLAAGLTQQTLAAAIGTKFQQLQKYETGMNRVSASRLWMICKALNIDTVQLFFPPMGAGSAGHGDVVVPITQDSEAMALAHRLRAMPTEARAAVLRIVDAVHATTA